jgi:23S rRNA pseudouridine2605 synthase
MSQAQTMRLQKYIADCGVTSRRKAELLITQGEVTVNGELVTELGTKVDPANDVVQVAGNVIDLDSIHKEYIVLHKPRCVMTTVSDPEGRETVMDYIYGMTSRVYPVGRLDYLSEGLLLLTNDGEFANHVMHPKFEVTKVYEVKVFGRVTPDLLKKLKTGIVCEDGLLRPMSVRVVAELPGKTWVEFMLNEGKNREIRRLCEACGLTIDKLKRVAIENLDINGIAPGKYVKLSRADMYKFLNLNFDGTRRAGSKVQYSSPKKSVKVRTPRGEFSKADNVNFQKFRKETYFETIKTKQLEEAAAAQAEKVDNTPRLTLPRAEAKTDFDFDY